MQGVLGCIPNVSKYFLQHSHGIHFVQRVSGLKGPQQHNKPVVSLSSADPESGDFKGLERKKKSHFSPRKMINPSTGGCCITEKKQCHLTGQHARDFLKHCDGFGQTPGPTCWMPVAPGDLSLPTTQENIKGYFFLR